MRLAGLSHEQSDIVAEMAGVVGRRSFHWSAVRDVAPDPRFMIKLRMLGYAHKTQHGVGKTHTLWQLTETTFKKLGELA